MAERKNEAIWIENRSRWQINVQDDGKRKTFTCSQKGKKGKITAEKKADDWFKNKYAQINIRFDRAWENFLEDTKVNISEIYHKQLISIGKNYLLPYLKHKKVTDITSQNWQSCIDHAFKKGLSKKTLKNIRGAATTFCRYAKKCRMNIEKPEDIIINKKAPVKTKNILQPQDIQTLFNDNTVTIRGKQEFCFFIYAFRFLLLSGLRRSEICSLKKSDIKDNVLYIHGTKTAAADRKIALGIYQKQILQQQEQYLKRNGIISPYLFPDENGSQCDSNHLYKKWSTYRKCHNIKSTLHELRHTLISISKTDMPEELLKLVVGHTDKTDTFNIYGHEVDGDLERAASIFDNIFSKLIKIKTT